MASFPPQASTACSHGGLRVLDAAAPMHKSLSCFGLFPLVKASHLAQPRLQGWREGQVLMPEAIKSHCKAMSLEEWEEFETIVVKNLPQFVLLSSREVWGTNRTGSQGPKVEQFEQKK